MRYFIIATLTVLFFSIIPEQTSSGFCFFYHFLHVNVFHLAANALSIWFIYRRWDTVELVLSFLIATGAYFTAMTPILGFSNIIYATIGLRTPPLVSPWWRLASTKIFLATTLLMFLLPNVSAVTHVVSFMTGASMAAFGRWAKGIIHDSSRYMD